MQHLSILDLKGVDKKTLEALKKAGVETLQDLKLADMPQFCKRTGLSETRLREILLQAELQAYEVPLDIAEALVASGAIGRVGELAAFDVEDIRALLRKGPKLGKALDVGIKEIEALKENVQRLTLDEETTRGVLLEETEIALHDEVEPSLRAEELVVSKGDVKALVAELERTFQQHSDKMKAMMKTPGESIDLANVQALLSSLQVDIQTVLAQVIEKVEPDLEVLMVEDEAPKLADEEIELDVQIQTLSKQLVTVQDQLAELQKRRIAFDEELSPTAAEEGEPTELRGEED